MKRIYVCIALLALLGLSACGVKVSDNTKDMTPFEFLCAIMDWEECGRYRSGDPYYYTSDGTIVPFQAMLEQGAEHTDEVDFEIEEWQNEDGTARMRFSLNNGTDRILTNPFKAVEIAVELEEKWYLVPNMPVFSDADVVYKNISSGESLETWMYLGNDYTSILPDGHYRLQLELDGKYAVREFEIDSGEVRTAAE